VVLAKAATQAIDDPFALFSEWSGEEDRRAYSDL
jgi:hypothetical protein